MATTMVTASADTRMEASDRQPVILVTGLSGAGRSSSLKALEDIGYEAVDNLPIALLPALLAPGAAARRPLVVGVDVRGRDFAAEPLLAEIERLKRRSDLDARLLFLDCDADVLVRRFTETRRRHPIAVDRPLADGIQKERALMLPIRERADEVLDTSTLAGAELRRVLWNRFQLGADRGLSVTVTSFSFRHGLPREADLVLDVRFLENPHYDPVLRPLDGRDESVAEFIATDPDFEPFFASITAMLDRLIPRYYREGKSYLTIAFGCTGGRHRSVFLAERLGAWLAKRGQRVEIVHRDVDRARS
ncbi:MAG: RNase adapter RapZ [Alphaproteobacteria bacterium]|nr:RNase adapter RapZ [Alphaproteobacteria bacterium]